MERWTYSKAGVDINLQKKMQESFLQKSTKKAEGLGKYASTFRIDNKEVTLHVDGVGTKVILLHKFNKDWVSGWDCVMVNANDVACEGYKGVLLVDYLAVEKADPKLSEEIARGLSEGLDAIGAVLAGGETAIMPDVIKGYDISCTLLGIRVGRPRDPKEGDVVIAVKSTGPHANGYTLIRRLIDQGLIDINEIKEVLNPVANYHNALLEGMKSGVVKWAAHVTGGAFKKVHERLPEGLGIELEQWDIPKVFSKIVEAGNLDAKEAYTTFNMGIGLIVIGTEDAVEVFRKDGLEAWVAGRVVKGPTKIKTPWGVVEIK